MGRPVLVLRHEDPDHLGLGAEVLTAAGLRLEPLDLWLGGPLPAPGDVAAIVVLGGTMGVGDAARFPFLTPEQELIRESVEHGVPVLGLCLGAQLLAAALGGEVGRAPTRSIGFLPVAQTSRAASDPLFHNWCAEDRLFRWHEDTFTLPAGAELLMSAGDVPNQAFRVGDSAWGVQFHMELDRPLLEAWIASSPESALAEWGASPQDLRDGADTWLAHQQAHATQAFAAFADVVLRRAE
jgi:GMP synthase (glutamine-hydrolysing)